MKNVYFIRHGESEENIDGIRRGASAKLTQKGKRQAKVLAERFANMRVDLILSSPYERAIETAKEIKNTTNAKLQIADMAHERVLSQCVMNKHRNDPKVVMSVEKIEELWKEGREVFGGGESFEDLLSRVDSLIDSVNKIEEENIVIVSHAYFGKVFALRVLLQEKVNAEMVVGSVFNIHYSNTGITQYKVDENGNWTLRVWNDDRHLG